jgi:hypothetical protein
MTPSEQFRFDRIVDRLIDDDLDELECQACKLLDIAWQLKNTAERYGELEVVAALEGEIVELGEHR